MIEPHRKQAWRNHGQSLEKLNCRGGLGVRELFAVLQDIPYEVVSQTDAMDFLLRELGNAGNIPALSREDAGGTPA